jgi:hypothetical protein
MDCTPQLVGYYIFSFFFFKKKVGSGWLDSASVGELAKRTWVRGEGSREGGGGRGGIDGEGSREKTFHLSFMT